jgi:hypothetical protein
VGTEAIAPPQETTTPVGAEVVPVSHEDALAQYAAADRAFRVSRWQRAMVAPHLAGAGTWAYGECAHLIEMAAHQPLAVGASTAALATGAMYLTRYGALRTVFTHRWSLRFWLAGTTATLWSTLAAVLDTGTTPGWLLTGALAGTTVTLAGRWWQDHRIVAGPVPSQLPAADEDEDTEDEVLAAPITGADRIVERWETFLSAKGKKFAHSILAGERELATGWAFEIVLDPDHNTFDDLVPARPKIAGVMGLAPADIVIELHPDGDYSRGLISFLTTNPLKDGVAYTGPRYDNGYVASGPYADGDGWGSVQLTDHVATVINGLVTGDPGSGKSVFLENLGMSALHSRRWKVLYNDGSIDNDSSPILSNYMTASDYGLTGAWAQLAAVKEYMTGRGIENAALPEDVRGVNPSPARKGLLWIIDELHLLLKADQDFAKELEIVVRLGRKKGVAVWCATQGLDLNLDFAGNSTLRDILTSRNVVCFYTSSKYAHNLINGPTMAPYTLPTDGGWAYLRAAGSNRAAMLRTDFTQDMSPWARALPNEPWGDDEVGELALGAYIAEAHRSPEQSMADARIALETYKQTRRLGLPSGTPAAVLARAANPWADLTDRVAELVPLPLTIAVEEPEDASVTKKAAIVTELARRGRSTTGELAAALGFELSVVSQALRRAAGNEEVRDCGHGKWESIPTRVGAA